MKHSLIKQVMSSLGRSKSPAKQAACRLNAAKARAKLKEKRDAKPLPVND